MFLSCGIPRILSMQCICPWSSATQTRESVGVFLVVVIVVIVVVIVVVVVVVVFAVVAIFLVGAPA